MLARNGWYGDPNDGLQQLFKRAHVDVRAWAKQMKIRTSQRMFMFGLAPT